MDKGKQFEHAVCQAAWNMAGLSNLSSRKRSDYDSNQNLISRGTITSDCISAANEAIRQIESKLSNPDWKTTRQLGGTRPEPKTDVIIGRNVKMSLKWEDGGYQLSSGNPRFTTRNLKNSLDVMYEQGDYKLSDYREISELLDAYGRAFSDVGTRPSSQIDRILERNQQLIGSINTILASDQSAGDLYAHFNRALVYEALTGEQLFGENNEKTANYVLGNLSGFHRIDDAYVNAVAKHFKVRILSKKGRSTPRGAAERNQELSGRFELTAVGASRVISELSRLP
jgi:hypothetical protein|tara:strand:- start:49 stop:900 length:852 start_codon:yes stop_codon:yes gene_type:complete